MPEPCPRLSPDSSDADEAIVRYATLRAASSYGEHKTVNAECGAKHLIEVWIARIDWEPYRGNGLPWPGGPVADNDAEGGPTGQRDVERL
jgi:hypothetical protein